jgi:hypothetical protein
MVSFLLDTKHGHCGICGKKRPLKILYLTRREKPKLLDKPENVHAAICKPCWLEVAWEIFKDYFEKGPN